MSVPQNSFNVREDVDDVDVQHLQLMFATFQVLRHSPMRCNRCAPEDIFACNTMGQ